MSALKEFVLIIGLGISIFVVVATWPILQIQFRGFNNSIEIGKPFYVAVWNKGGSVSGYSIITPTVCISGDADGNITCQHSGYGNSTQDCNMVTCSNIPPGLISPEDVFTFKFPEHIPDNFMFRIKVAGNFGPFPIAHTEADYLCDRKGMTRYDCVRTM
jgi:hypothetical protein